MTAEITVPRREKLAAALADKEAIILFAAGEANLEKFKQDNNFLYVTGLQIPEAIYVMYNNGPIPAEYLFIQRNDPAKEVWDGRKMSAEEAKELSGIDHVVYLDEFSAVISMFCPAISKIWANIGSQSMDRPLTMQLYRLSPIRERFPNIVIESITSLITPLRKIKSEWELMQLQRAIDITGKAVIDVMEGSISSMMEYELEAMMFYRMQRMGVKQWGFSPIVGSGINAATLHYKANECRIESGEVVLMDVGASYMNYSADITRCFPISGSFSERQKQIYSIVLDVQKQVIEMIKPGVELGDLNRSARDLLANGMLEIGLIDDVEDVNKYYMHSVSHFLGMDTHDVGGRSAILEAGNVITVEPGIYIPEEKLGIRIEDDVLVTSTGYCVLSQNIPKEIEELEEIRKAALSK
ncbi:MAG: Xaa-Pro aminopeptidase [Candidatus Cloacimonetes bacterium HGW-Cloacimonetes-3]|jgi:Xaa-Pro aminopeptidase|nr:MAG: Xaa-Pro aminopeptidase [Candidatus Cloacimonetes bacterium HGW-Cloacimonetes-3]